MQRFTRAAAVFGVRVPKRSGRPVRYILAWLAISTVAFLPVGPVVAAGSLTDTSVALSSPIPAQTGVDYTFTGSSVDGALPVLCVQVVWSTTSSGNTSPAGFSGASGSVNASASTLINSSATGWSLAKSDGTSSSGQNNIYQYTNATGVTPSTTTGATFELSGITNPSTADTGYFLKLNTYGNIDCVSSPIDNADVQFIATNESTLSLTVDDSLSFSVGTVGSGQPCDGTTTTEASTATTLPFGDITTAANSIVCHDLQAATNGTNGYTIYARYTGALTDGTHNIADVSGTNAAPASFTAPGVEGYGYSTDDSSLGTGTPDRFTNPSQKWAPMTTSNEEIGYESAPVTNQHYKIAHQAGIAITTLAGTYQTTIIYTCTPVY